MLPGLGFSEILLLGVIALLVVGPKDLPLMLRELGKWTRKLQGMAAEFRQGFDELARQAELDELRKEVEAMRQSAMIPDVETILTAPPETQGLAPDPSITAAEPEAAALTPTADGHVEAAPEPAPEPASEIEISPASKSEAEAAR
jgi:sec-independent protein translocase protein TatB